MYVYIIDRQSKVVHLSQCAHLRNVDRNRVGYFSTLEIARKYGYHLCKHCAPINRFLKGKRSELDRYCQQNGMLYRLEDGCVLVHTPYSKWKIIMVGKTKKCIFLYHKNVYDAQEPSMVPGYHSQTVRRNSILEYLEYIKAHDEYRRRNPIMLFKEATPPPLKGTKRWHKEQQQQRHSQHRQDVRRVLFLLDELEKANRWYAANASALKLG